MTSNKLAIHNIGWLPSAKKEEGPPNIYYWCHPSSLKKVNCHCEKRATKDWIINCHCWNAVPSATNKGCSQRVDKDILLSV